VPVYCCAAAWLVASPLARLALARTVLRRRYCCQASCRYRYGKPQRRTVAAHREAPFRPQVCG
jgi:hypothetical protein